MAWVLRPAVAVNIRKGLQSRLGGTGCSTRCRDACPTGRGYNGDNNAHKEAGRMYRTTEHKSVCALKRLAARRT